MNLMGKKIKFARELRGLSQDALAKSLFVSRSAIAKWESGKGFPEISNLKRLVNILEISIDYLLDDEKQINEIILPQTNIFIHNGGISEMNNKYESLKILIYNYNNKYEENYPILQHAADNYQEDFSIILKQEYINALAEFVNYQIMFRDSLELLVLKTSDDNIQPNIKQLYKDVNSFSFEKLFLEYVNECNSFISSIKEPNINTFDKQLEIAKPVLEKWQEYMTKVNKFNQIITSLAEILQ